MGSTVVAAAIYCRISKDKAGEALGVARQEQLCRELAEGKGWTVAEVYVDNDLSASKYAKKVRPSYQRLLKDITDGVRDAVIVVDTDRLIRQLRELEDFIDLADKFGVELANVSGDMDLASADGRFKARIMGTVAVQESDKKSERIKRQRDQLVTMGKPHPKGRSFGFEPDGVTHREHEAELIRSGAAALLSGRSLGAVAREWNDLGVTTVTGQPWNTRSVSNMFKQPKIGGHRVHRGDIAGKGSWEPIVDDVTWERLSAMFRSRRRGPGRPARHLLSGLLTCDLCGVSMRSSGSKGKQIYSCQKDPVRKGCGRLSILMEKTDEEIREQLLYVVAHDGLANVVSNITGMTDHSAKVARQLERDREMLDQLARDYYDEGVIGRAEFFTNREALERRISKNSRALERISVAVPDIPSDYDGARAWWEKAPTDARRRLVELLVDKIVVQRQDPTRPRFFDPDRLEVVWRS